MWAWSPDRGLRPVAVAGEPLVPGAARVNQASDPFPGPDGLAALEVSVPGGGPAVVDGCAIGLVEVPAGVSLRFAGRAPFAADGTAWLLGEQRGRLWLWSVRARNDPAPSRSSGRPSPGGGAGGPPAARP